MLHRETSQGQEHHMNACTGFIANAQRARLVKAANRALEEPAEYPQPASTLRVVLGDHPPKASPRKSSSVWTGVTRSARKELLPRVNRVARLPRDRGNAIDEGDQPRHIVPIAAGPLHAQWSPVGVPYHMVARGTLPLIYRAGRDLLARATPWTCELCAASTDDSIWASARRRSGRASWTFSQAPAYCPTSRCRQQLIPERQPISRGRSSGGMPASGTNTIPVTARRRPSTLRVGCRSRRSSLGGRGGSTALQRSSSSDGLPIAAGRCALATPAFQAQTHGPFR